MINRPSNQRQHLAMDHRRSPLQPLAALALLLAVTLVGVGQARSATPSVRPGGAAFTTANGVTIQAGEPLPVFRFSAPQVTNQTARLLATEFEGITPPRMVPPVDQETYRDRPRYTVPNTATTSLLTQYGATSGFYAYNAEGIAQARQRDPQLDGPETRIRAGAIDNACQFLLTNGFIDSNGNLLVFQQPQGPQGFRASVPSLASNCPLLAPKPLANTAGPAALMAISTSLIRATDQPSAPGSPQGATKVIGVAVQVPIQVQVGTVPLATAVVPRYVPLGGAGGHISLLLNALSADTQIATLDASTPGLGAVALPFFGRAYTKLKDASALDPALVKQQVTQQVQAAFPNATSVSVPDPALFYNVSDAAQEQLALEPVLSFANIQVTVGGNTINLRDIMQPAVAAGSGANGFGPTVSIISPANNATFPTGGVTLTGRISGGTGPYSYQWLLDDETPLGQPTNAAVAGDVTLQTTQLPRVGRNRESSAVSIILRVQDADGAVREGQVAIRPDQVPQAFMPLLLNRSPLMAAARTPSAQSGPTAVQNYAFAVHAAADYPPYGAGGPDLPGVVPDAAGFRSGLLNYGWSQSMYFANANVWERDWRDCSLGGGDCDYGMDRADFAYFAGHGGPGSMYPSRSDRDSDTIKAENARFQRLRWVGFASCQTLRVQGYAAPNEPIRRWFNAFQGSSMLLGFNSNMADVAFGPRVVDNMRIPSFAFFGELPWAQLSIRDAWVKTAFDMNAGKPAYIWATSPSYNPANERLPKGSDPLKPRPFPVNWFYWVWWDE